MYATMANNLPCFAIVIRSSAEWVRLMRQAMRDEQYLCNED
jgi:ABC-type dipeptide/oligopeptide/nickel transport system permease component